MHLVGGRDGVVVPRVENLQEPAVALALQLPRHGFPGTPAFLALAAPLARALRHEVRAAAVARKVPADHVALGIVASRGQLLLYRALLGDAVPGAENVQLKREDGVFGSVVGAFAKRARRVDLRGLRGRRREGRGVGALVEVVSRRLGFWGAAYAAAFAFGFVGGGIARCGCFCGGRLCGIGIWVDTLLLLFLLLLCDDIVGGWKDGCVWCVLISRWWYGCCRSCGGGGL